MTRCRTQCDPRPAESVLSRLGARLRARRLAESHRRTRRGARSRRGRRADLRARRNIIRRSIGFRCLRFPTAANFPEPVRRAMAFRRISRRRSNGSTSSRPMAARHVISSAMWRRARCLRRSRMLTPRWTPGGRRLQSGQAGTAMINTIARLDAADGGQLALLPTGPIASPRANCRMKPRRARAAWSAILSSPCATTPTPGIICTISR